MFFIYVKCMIELWGDLKKLTDWMSVSWQL